MLKRLLKYSALCVGALICLSALALWAMAQGVQPLKDGRLLAQGKVRVVVDGESPIPVASYLIQLKDGSLGLVDAGMDPEAKSIRAALAAMGRRAEDVRVIFLTHLHGDHAGGVRAFPWAEVFALSVENKGGNGQSAWERFQGKGQHEAGSMRVTRRLKDGESLDSHGTAVECFALAGHTMDSAVYLIHGVLFLGDGAAAQRDEHMGGPPPVFSADRPLGQSQLHALAKGLLNRQGEIHDLAFGHQGPLSGVDALKAWAVTDAL